MKNVLRVCLGLVLAFALFQVSKSQTPPPFERPADGYMMIDDHANCSTTTHWSHCVYWEKETCDVSAQHEECEPDVTPVVID